MMAVLSCFLAKANTALVVDMLWKHSAGVCISQIIRSVIIWASLLRSRVLVLLSSVTFAPVPCTIAPARRASQLHANAYEYFQALCLGSRSYRCGAQA